MSVGLSIYRSSACLHAPFFPPLESSALRPCFQLVNSSKVLVIPLIFSLCAASHLHTPFYFSLCSSVLLDVLDENRKRLRFCSLLQIVRYGFQHLPPLMRCIIALSFWPSEKWNGFIPVFHPFLMFSHDALFGFLQIHTLLIFYFWWINEMNNFLEKINVTAGEKLPHSFSFLRPFRFCAFPAIYSPHIFPCFVLSPRSI